MKAIICNICRQSVVKPLRVSVLAFAAVRVGNKSPSKSIHVGRIDMCDDCYERVVEYREPFSTAFAVRRWIADTKQRLAPSAEPPETTRG